MFAEMRLPEVLLLACTIGFYAVVIDSLVSAVQQSKHSLTHVAITWIVPYATFMGYAVALMKMSPLVNQYPVFMFIAAGLVHAHSVTRLIICTVSKMKYTVLGPEMIAVAWTLTGLALGLGDKAVLSGMLIGGLIYSQYIVVVIGQITSYLGIKCLTITPKKV